MSDEASSSSRPRRRGRGSRYKLRRFSEVEQVVVEAPFTLTEPRDGASSEDQRAGEGCYISATIQGARRYYGVLVEQKALVAASILHFKDEAGGLDLNRRMKALKERQRARASPPLGDDGKEDRKEPASNLSQETNASVSGNDNNGDSKRPASNLDEDCKRQKRLRTNLPDNAFSAPVASTTGAIPKITSAMDLKVAGSGTPPRQVQKFRYVESSPENGSESSDYRVLLATYADIDAAAEGLPGKAEEIGAACHAGGDFVGDFYYQFEVRTRTLQVSDYSNIEDSTSMRTSLGFHSFLQETDLPTWFPLANMHADQQKVLNILSLKKDSNGNVIWDDKATNAGVDDDAKLLQGTSVPMEPRSFYRVCVVGGGIAGLSCCLELFRHCERERIDIEVVLLEGRSRFGGRLYTDTETFKYQDDSAPFPVDLGASWIHGIELNPLAALAKEAGVDFVTTSEEVKMLKANMAEVDAGNDDRAGKLFDKLLDHAAEDSWENEEVGQGGSRNQHAVRWYASVLDNPEVGTKTGDSQAQRHRRAKPTDAPPHRQSSDVSVDHAVGKAIAKYMFSDFARLSEEERRMVFWNLKNVEYALGANIADLSMKFWDIDERHAFEGDHVILKQGYSVVVEHLVRNLKQRGERFKFILDCPVGKLEYSRKTSTQPYSSGLTRRRQLLELSDTCCVTSQDESTTVKCDFVVCAAPLGVLKESVSDADKPKLKFEPQLPVTKRDSIESVGFGILDKVYLQFPHAFWRSKDVLDAEQTLFGNASGANPHHYMFFDIGKSLGTSADAPAVLMSLVSGNEAVDCEWLTEEAVVDETMRTLRTIFSNVTIPDPIAFRATKWGADKMSRGSYTFLTPGTTDQDFQVLQSPVNGNGDSLLLDSSETMRLFFAGEHTTALHPSMAHGAMLSGIRAANDVVAALTCSFENDENIDRLIPMSLFRHLNPKAKLSCSLCGRLGSRVREGNLLAFKRGARQVLVHNNCAENSPEVEVFEGQWSHVLKAVNRARQLECALCGRTGASIGCTAADCDRCYHFSCAEDTGWRFDQDGKVHYCDLHRTMHRDDCDAISLEFYQSKTAPGSHIACVLCGLGGDDKVAGKLLAFRQRFRLAVVHEKCVRYTTIVDTSQESVSRFDQAYRNVFAAIDHARVCARCNRSGATIECTETGCNLCYHFGCAHDLGLKPEKTKSSFRCLRHSEKQAQASTTSAKSSAESVAGTGMFQHALFSAGDSGAPNVPGNLDIGGSPLLAAEQDSSSGQSGESDEDVGEENIREYPLTSSFESDKNFESQLVRVFRKSRKDPWNLEFDVKLSPTDRKNILSIASCSSQDPYDGLRQGDIVEAVNGTKIGTAELDSLNKVLLRLGQEVDVMMEVKRVL